MDFGAGAAGGAVGAMGNHGAAVDVMSWYVSHAMLLIGNDKCLLNVSHLIACFSSKVHGNSCHLPTLFDRCLLDDSRVCRGYYQSLLSVFQLGFSFFARTSLAFDNLLPLLWSLFD